MTEEAINGIIRYTSENRMTLNDGYHTHEICDNQQRKWKIVRDSSIAPSNSRNTAFNRDNYRCELVTPILEYKLPLQLPNTLYKQQMKGTAFPCSL